VGQRGEVILRETGLNRQPSLAVDKDLHNWNLSLNGVDLGKQCFQIRQQERAEVGLFIGCLVCGTAFAFLIKALVVRVDPSEPPINKSLNSESECFAAR
jgi:hypothetical protein